MDLYERIMELGSMGYHCSQIIMIMTLETIGEENPQLVKAMGGLGGGIGYCGDTCGCLTGSACAIGYFLGNLAPEEKEDAQMKPAGDQAVSAGGILVMEGNPGDWYMWQTGKYYGRWFTAGESVEYSATFSGSKIKMISVCCQYSASPVNKTV